MHIALHVFDGAHGAHGATRLMDYTTRRESESVRAACIATTVSCPYAVKSATSTNAALGP
jgi:hypothetical protein